MRCKNKGFTIIEILTVLAIMAILVGALLPALNTARNAARQAKQRVQFVSIEQALLAWRNDFGEYPQSSVTVVPDGTNRLYCGAQKLAEAMLGLDLMGFYKDSKFDGNPLDYPNPVGPIPRKPRYLELETANAFFLGDHFDAALNQNLYGLFKQAELSPTNLVPYGYVLCDVFLNRTVNIGGKSVKAGRPILYYEANPSGDGLRTQQRQMPSSIYRYTDNYDLANLGRESSNPWTAGDFVNFVTDPKVQRAGAWPWPHRPDSYILISAGIDGLYGTADDITNFGY
jgi:prepilin-type N-terminal cleavage/methylation domain-containing protein